MSTRTLQMTDALYAYLLENSLREPDVLKRLRDRTAELEFAGWQIAPEQGQFMALLVELIGAERCIEVGTFTGYSALAVALALPDDGELIACDISDEYPSIGRPFWEEAGVVHKIDLRLAPGIETLNALIAEGRSGDFDFVFIDAEKQTYPDYFDRAVDLVRTGGLIAVDNVLWGGSVADPANTKSTTEAIRVLNRKVQADERVTMSLVPIGDGLLVARKR